MKRQPLSDFARYAYGFSDDRRAARRDLRNRIILLLAIFAVALFLVVIEAKAEELGIGCTEGDMTVFCVQDYGPTDLGKAMGLCDGHSHWDAGHVNAATPPTFNREYEKGWERCGTVAEKWSQTEYARMERQRAAQDQIDLEFVNKVANQ